MTIDRARLLMKGIAASPGIVIGPAVVLDRRRTQVPQRHLAEGEVELEIARLRSSIDASRREIEAARDSVPLTADHLLVLEAHLMMHRDELLVDGAVTMIRSAGINAEWALRRIVDDIKTRLSASRDTYFRERADDVEHVGDHILRVLVGESVGLPVFDGPTVLVMPDLSPADAARLVQSNVVGLVTDLGSATSHSAILSRALEIPAVVGVSEVTRRIGDGDVLIVDGLRGEVLLNADESERTRAEERGRRYRVFSSRLRARRGKTAKTRDGVRIGLHANVELPAEAALAVAAGAAGVGLYRTEFLLLDRTEPPDEDEQARVYSDIVRVMAPRPVVLRTFDVGGDKLPVNDRVPRGPNPALGLRALRLSLARPELLRTQLRAMLRAAAHGNAKVLLPLVTTVSELRAARTELDRARRELEERGVAVGRVTVGVMIEVPSAAIMSDVLARECDFFSVGTNDLVQYTLALDRSNPDVAYLARPLDPAILRLLDITARSADQRGIEVSMCGDMASHSIALPIVLGLGYRALSMPVAALAMVREVISRVDLSEARRAAREALLCETADDVEQIVFDRFGGDLQDLWAEQGHDLPS